MADKSKHENEDRKPHPQPVNPAAASVDREPNNEPTPEGHGLAVNKDDEPKGHPTSDRFRTEQADHKSESSDS